MLSRKAKEGELLLVDSLEMAAPKTKTMAGALQAWSKVKGFNKLSYQSGRRALVLLPGHAAATVKSFRNLPTVGVCEAREVNPVLLANYQYVIVANPHDSLAAIAGRSLNKSIKAK